MSDIWEGATLRFDHLGCHHGQHDYVLRAIVAGIEAGRLAFAEYEGAPNVQMIEVHDGFRRKGYASDMLYALQERYPTVPITFGYSTEEGSALIASLEFAEVANEGRASAEREFGVVAARLADYARRAEALDRASGAEKLAFFEEVSDWNDLSDRADELERIIETEPAAFRFLRRPASPAIQPDGVYSYS